MKKLQLLAALAILKQGGQASNQTKRQLFTPPSIAWYGFETCTSPSGFNANYGSVTVANDYQNHDASSGSWITMYPYYGIGYYTYCYQYIAQSFVFTSPTVLGGTYDTASDFLVYGKAACSATGQSISAFDGDSSYQLLTAGTSYDVNTAGTTTSSPPCGYQLFVIWEGVENYIQFSLYNLLPSSGPYNLGDCSSFATTNFGFHQASSNYAAEGYSAGVQVVLQPVLDSVYFYCYHFYTNDFMTTVPSVTLGTDSSSQFSASYYSGITSDGSCIADPSITIASAGSGSLVASQEYTPSSDTGTVGTDPCGYLVYYSWQGTHGTVEFSYYIGKTVAAVATNLGDCSSFSTTTHGSHSTPSDYVAQGYTGGFVTTLGAISSGDYYYCSHFHTTDFKVITPTQGSNSDSNSEFTIKYYSGITSSGSCIADPSITYTSSSPGTLNVNQVYTPSSDTGTVGTDPCGYLVYYAWQGINGNLVITVYTGKPTVLTDLGDCASFATTSFGSHTTPSDYVAQGYTGGFQTTLAAISSHESFYCYHFHLTDFMVTSPTVASGSDSSSEFVVTYASGVTSSGSCIANSGVTISTSGLGSVTASQEYTPSSDSGAVGTYPCGYMVYYSWTGTNGNVVFTVYTGKPTVATNLGDCSSFATTADGSHTTPSDYVAQGYTGGFKTTLSAITSDESFYCSYFHTTDFMMISPTVASGSDTSSQFTVTYYSGITSSGVCIADPSISITSSGAGTLTTGQEYTPSSDSGTVGTQPCGYQVFYSWIGTNGNVVFNVYTGKSNVPTNLGDCSSFGTTSDGSHTTPSDYTAQGFTGGFKTTLAAISSHESFYCSHFHTTDFMMTSPTVASGSDSSSEFTVTYYSGITSSGSCIADPSITISSASPGTLTAAQLYTPSSDTGVVGTNPCGYLVYYSWTGTNGNIVFSVYTSKIVTASNLGDCASFATTSDGSHTTPSDYVAQGYTGGFSTTLNQITTFQYFYCSHFHTTDFMLATPTISSGSDTSSEFSTKYFSGITSSGSCIADPSITITSSNPDTLTAGQEYTPSSDSGTVGTQPCGYLVYYSWQGTHGTTIFTVYTGKPIVPTNLGDCASFATTSDGSHTTPSDYVAQGFTGGFQTTLAAISSHESFYCSHFHTSDFMMTSPTVASGSDTSSEFTVTYYSGITSSGSCIANSSTTINTASPGTLAATQLYTPSSDSGTVGTDPCGYLVYYSWTGTNGNVIFKVYTGKSITATNLGDCASFATTSDGSHAVPSDYVAQGYLGGFQTTLSPISQDKNFYCSHFHTTDFMMTAPTIASGSDTTSEFTATFYSGITSSGSCIANPSTTINTANPGTLTAAQEYTPSSDSGTVGTNPCGYLVYYQWSGTNGNVVFTVYTGKPTVPTNLGDCSSFATTADGSHSTPSDYVAQGYTGGFKTTLAAITKDESFYCSHFHTTDFMMTAPTVASIFDSSSEFTVTYYSGITSGGSCIADPSISITSSSPGTLTSSQEYTPSSDSGTVGTNPCGYLVYYSWTGTNGNVVFSVYTGKPIVPTNLGDCASFVTSADGSNTVPSDYVAQGYLGGFQTTLAPITQHESFYCSHFHITDFMMTAPIIQSGSDTSSEFTAKFYPGITSSGACIADPSITINSANPGTLTVSKQYNPSSDSGIVGTNPCGFLVYYSWQGTNGNVEFKVYTGKPIVPTNLGDCASFVTSADGSNIIAPNPDTQGYTGGFKTTLSPITKDQSFYCSHFHKTDFMMTAPTIQSGSDTSSKFTTSYYSGITSGGSCIADPSISITSANPGTLTVAQEYTPSSDSGTVGTDPCGYLVYYQWQGTNGDVIFTVYTGKTVITTTPTVQSLGNCLTMTTTANGSVKQVINKSDLYTTKNIVTLGAASSTTQYSCHNFFQSMFMSKEHLRISPLDQTTDLTMEYFKGDLVGRVCTLPSSYTKATGIIQSETIYLPTSTVCGYFVIYTWKGTHGGVKITIESN